ncbi:MAG: peptidoglycan-binding protein [Clostridia bacterium]|nr:peptidoglycan-binding protein [Clostridia bacterium]
MPNRTNDTAVRNLQRYLRRLSFEENAILPVPIDGIFDTRTEEALMEFQRMYELPVTGRADRGTWDLLFAEYLRLSEEEDRIEAIDLFPKVPPNYVTTLGEESAFILLLQWLLSELLVIYDTLPEFARSGRFDQPTSDAVREFQRIQRIEETGLVDRNTWNRIAREYGFLTQNPL